jgi:hypothetical protein
VRLTVFRTPNNNVVILPRVASRVSGAVIANATVTATLYNPLGQLADANFDHVAMTPMPGQPGGYSCTVAGITATAGEGYYVLFDGSSTNYSFRARQAANVSERWI